MDIYNSPISINKHDELLYERNKNSINYIDYILVNEFQLCKSNYILRGLITQKFSGHYSVFLINVKNDSLLIKKGVSYYYDDRDNDNEILKVDDWRKMIKEYIPILALYEKL